MKKNKMWQVKVINALALPWIGLIVLSLFIEEGSSLSMICLNTSFVLLGISLICIVWIYIKTRLDHRKSA